ncbi:hypothetical protein BZA05DRAFT_128008 [Tricharina praecox]|uniref:uncharacterized protein n=1 Tax=Tricharina praecox TaxID=43433 RepID=UPI0022200DB9|nr:uncharacterized protein BZA05DRAFT_128008 [Tricharina praecox]KAI5846821.1 hypothetical protein BZA05DRAFT_128008 [Tricharina praecox]
MSDLQRYLQDLEVHAGGEAVPTTRLPALHPSSRIEVGGRNEQISVDAAFEAVENCVVGFARFIGLLTGTDEVTLEVEGKSLVAVVRRDTATTEVVLRLVEDTVVESDFVLRVENTSVSPESRCRTSCAAEEKPFVLTLTSTTLDLSYAPSIVPPTAAAHLLSAVASYMLPSAPLPDLSILNHSAQKAPCNPVFTLLHSGFEHAAATYPSHPALDFLTGLPACHEVYTYAELNAVANRVAAAIHAMATDEQRIVPVYLGTSPQLYISYLAILKSGRAFCPLPIDAPIEGLSGILADMANGIVIGRGAVPASMEGRWLDIDAAIRTRESATTTPIAPREVMPEDIAYVLYTSGTDGRPKGVQISHLSATCAIDSNAQILPLSTFPAVPSRWFQFSAHTFGPSILEIFVTLSSGATLCSAERELTLANVEAVTTSLRASVMMATPSLTAAMKPAQMPTLRSLWAMGEVLGRRVIDGFAEDSLIRGIVTVDDSENGPRGLTNGYGPAEGAINCTLFPFPADYRGTIIGPPLPTCSLFVIDQESERPCPLPLGLVGELAIGGPQVAIGYLNRPEETARAFIDSEFGRLYRTGDRARVVWTREGEPVIEFLGRISEIATIGSGRVILGDVDAAVETARGVSQVATVVCSSKQGDKLVTCVVPAPGGFVEEVCDDLVTDMLPAHMRPWKYVTFPVLPTNSSGRLDRAALTNAVEVALKDCHPSFTPATSLSASGDVTPSPERAISYWKTQLDSFSPEPFPHLTGLKTSAIRQVSETVDITSKISSADLADRSRAVDSSPLAALQAAWGLILASYSDTMSEDNVFGTVRMGVFDTGSGVVPTRINLATISKESPARVESVLQHLSRANVEALQHLKFPAQALSGTHGEPPYSTVLAFETPASDILSTTATSFAVVIDVLPAANGSLKLIATFKDEFLSRSGAEIMLRQMDDVLIHILSHPESVYTDVRSDVSPELRCSLNPKPQGEPEPEDCSALQLHGQFEEHAKTHPRDIAFIFKYDLDDDS